MARTSQTITQQEVAAYAAFCASNNIIHDGSEADAANADFVLNYFLNTWGEDITAGNLTQALPQLKPHLKFHSKAEVDLSKATVSFDETNRKKFAEWFEQQTFLEKDGEFGFQNAANILEELKGREVSKETIAAAIGRIEAPTSRYDTRVRRPLHYVKTKRRVNDPRGHIASDDGTGFLKKDMVRTSDGGWRSKNAAEQAADRRAAEAAKSSTASSLSAEEHSWRGLAEGTLRYGTHSQQFQIKKVYDSGVANGWSWRRIFESCNELVSQYKRAAEVGFRRF